MMADAKKPLPKTETKLINEAMFDRLARRDPKAEREAEDAVTSFAMYKMREDFDLLFAMGRCYHEDGLAVDLERAQRIARADEIAGKMHGMDMSRRAGIFLKAKIQALVVGRPHELFFDLVQERLGYPDKFAVVDVGEEPGYPRWEMNTPGGLRWQDLREEGIRIEKFGLTRDIFPEDTP